MLVSLSCKNGSVAGTVGKCAKKGALQKRRAPHCEGIGENLPFQNDLCVAMRKVAKANIVCMAREGHEASFRTLTVKIIQILLEI